MNRSTVIALLAGLLTITACFLPWAKVFERPDYQIYTGIKAGALKMPGLLHMAFASIYIIFSLTQKAWGQRANLLIIALNTAWFIRNFAELSIEKGGANSTFLYGFYLLLIGTLGMAGATLFSKK